ncbi:kazal-type serine protease inhibitor domain protein [Ichthyophthirius multifiliis]|uniref:Kazal-type serine protease inhibitor domain protein n=1 Tax=Ichthyophthirius multifiliis TaxID=5932 RepID=G0R0I3_ICHMU|nr:kazal-type serine protease inhibitor domain protein [Ichthyophthirius multifiliis]EGR29034.1 kazal-type serine protease inhibitor domain protein [Ichthyophthirius multifiliis]|eukprot:XP_004030270.1 kazal-type serine protease inhibitor domain protein [Ichthyophthirius multifiliis]
MQKQRIIEFMIDGDCNNFPQNAVFCNPNLKDIFKCSVQLNQRRQKNEKVCGYFNLNTNCVKNLCSQSYENGCEACQHEIVDYYVLGECQQENEVI